MKKLILAVLITFLAVPAFPQLLKFGIKAGAETTTVPTYSSLAGGANATIDALNKAEWGWHAGVFLRIKLLGIYVQPEVIFASQTFDYNVTAVQGNPATLVSQKFNRLSVPIMIGFKLGPLRINAGPAASVKIGSPEDLITDPNFQNLYKSATWGYQAGLGIDLFKKLTIDARYAGGFGKQESTTTIGGQSFTFTNAPPSILLSLGFMF
jgi:hypothetical protein